MSKGQRYPAESLELADAASGRRIRQITSHPSIHHHPFFFVPAYDQAMNKLIFVSYRTGKPQIFFEDRASGELVQATDRPDLADWSIIPSGDGRYVYFTAGTGGFRVNLDTFEEEQLADFGAVEMREKGMVGAAMGTTALSKSGRWWAVPVKSGPVTRFMLIDTEQKTSRVFLERDTIGHPQFCPDDDDLILYAGPLTDRVWLTDRSGEKNRRLYQREDKMQWVTHEVWVPGRRTVAFVDWPRGMKMIDVDRGVIRQLTYSPAWHAAPDDAGERFRLRHQLSRSRPAHLRGRWRSGRRGRAAVRQRGILRRASTGPGRFPTTTGRSRSKPRSTPIPIRASRRTARASCSPPTRPATPRSTRWSCECSVA